MTMLLLMIMVSSVIPINMKTTLSFLYKIVQLCLVAASTFVLPAALASAIWLDRSIYMTALHSPAYMILMGTATVWVSFLFMMHKIDKSNSRADNSNQG